jgi:hypothetical protein
MTAAFIRNLNATPATTASGSSSFHCGQRVMPSCSHGVRIRAAHTRTTAAPITLGLSAMMMSATAVAAGTRVRKFTRILCWLRI